MSGAPSTANPWANPAAPEFADVLNECRSRAGLRQLGGPRASIADCVTNPVNQHAVPALRPCSVIVMRVRVSRVCGVGGLFLPIWRRAGKRFCWWYCGGIIYLLARLRLASHLRTSVVAAAQ